MNIDDFISSRNQAYSDEILPYLKEKINFDSIEHDQDDELVFEIANLIMNECFRSANVIALSHLKAYHNWLVSNELKKD